MTQRRIEIDHHGPIDHFEMRTPRAGGGVVVLRGRNGAGKSLALQSVQALAGGSPPPVADGEEQGSISGLGIRVTFAKRVRRAGELEVHILEGEDPSLLVDPGVQDPIAADRRRITALLRMAHVEASADLFAPILGGDLARLKASAQSKTLAMSDLPDMAAGLKRDMNELALEREKARDRAASLAEALRERAGSMSTTDDLPSIDHAREQHRLATLAVERAKGQAEARAQAEDARDAARQRLADAADPQVDLLLGEMEAAKEREHAAKVAVDRARDDHTAAQTDLVRAGARLESAKREAQTLAAARAAMEAELPAATDLEALEREERSAFDAMQSAIRAADARKAAEDLAMQEKRAEDAAAAAEEFRTAARSVDTVVSGLIGQVAPDVLKVEDSRLYGAHATRGFVLFDELSQGEKWSIALPIAAHSVGRGGILVACQESWEALDPDNREKVRQTCVALGVTIYTALATSGPLRSRVEGEEDDCPICDGGGKVGETDCPTCSGSGTVSVEREP